jgi:7,8-dihydropterin-6-yl-methyl-4-(beta-D-ribofuranosyl)aminobenzene 5'-phosphate synthase
MCDDHGHPAAEAAWSAPRAVAGPATDPVTLPEVDEVTVTTLVDNVFDALLASSSGVTRTQIGTSAITCGTGCRMRPCSIGPT